MPIPKSYHAGARGGAGRHGGEGRAADLSGHACGRTVTFVLNDLSAVKPPPARCGRTRHSSGRCSMKSGIRFFLLFNSRLEAVSFHSRRRPRRSPTSSPRRRGTSPFRSASAPALPSIHSTGGKSWSASTRRQSRLNTHLDGPVRPVAGEFHRRRGVARGDRCRRSARQGQDRPAGQLCRRLGPLSDPSLSALPAAWRSRGLCALRRVEGGRGGRPRRPASSSTTTRRSGKIHGRWR